MGTAAAIILLLLLMKSSGGSAPPDDSSSDPSGDTPPKGDLAGAAGDLLGAGLGLLGTLGGLTAGGTGAGAAGTAALTGGTAGGVPTAVTPATIIPTTAAVGAAFPLGAVTVGLLANPFAWAVYFLIASKVVQAQEGEKTWQATLRYLNANAREMHGFEAAWTKAILDQKGARYTIVQQRDLRLDRTVQGLNITLQGWRSSFRLAPAPGETDTFRRLRALTIEYLRLRAAHGYRMMAYYLPGLEGAEANWSVAEGKLNAMYEDPTMPGHIPGIGGLAHIPLAFGGSTEQPRLNHTEYPNDPAQLRISPYVATPLNDLTAKDWQCARLMALAEAIFALRFDPRPGMDLDADAYARDTMRALGTGPRDQRVALEGLSTRGGLILTDPNVFGETVAFNPQAIRQQTNAAGHKQLSLVTP